MNKPPSPRYDPRPDDIMAAFEAAATAGTDRPLGITDLSIHIAAAHNLPWPEYGQSPISHRIKATLGGLEKDGTIVRYGVEWGGTAALGGTGVTRDTLKVGDHVIITGSPGRNPKDHRVRMVTLHRPKDGFGWGRKPGEVVD